MGGRGTRAQKKYVFAVHGNLTASPSGLPPKKNRHPHFSAQNVDFINVSKYNEKFPKNHWKRSFFWVNDSQKRLFFSLKIEKLTCFLLDSCFKFPRFFHRNHRKPRFFHVGYKNFGFSTFCGKIHVSGNPGDSPSITSRQTQSSTLFDCWQCDNQKRVMPTSGMVEIHPKDCAELFVCLCNVQREIELISKRDKRPVCGVDPGPQLPISATRSLRLVSISGGASCPQWPLDGGPHAAPPDEWKVHWIP